MTMPHLMNCPHSESGWCLDCVKAVHEQITPDEQHAWEGIKALADKTRRVQYYSISTDEWIKIRYGAWSRSDIKDVIENPHIYRVAKEGE